MYSKCYSSISVRLTVILSVTFQRRPTPCISSKWPKNSMQFTLGMPFLGVLGKFYRNRKGLKCDKATQLSLIFRKLRKCSCVRMGVGQQILVLGCEMSHLLTRTTDVCHCQQARQSAKSHASGDVYLLEPGPKLVGDDFGFGPCHYFLYFCIKI